jgi:hypothetical protein
MYDTKTAECLTLVKVAGGKAFAPSNCQRLALCAAKSSTLTKFDAEITRRQKRRGRTTARSPPAGRAGHNRCCCASPQVAVREPGRRVLHVDRTLAVAGAYGSVPPAVVGAAFAVAVVQRAPEADAVLVVLVPAVSEVHTPPIRQNRCVFVITGPANEADAWHDAILSGREKARRPMTSHGWPAQSSRGRAAREAAALRLSFTTTLHEQKPT